MRRPHVFILGALLAATTTMASAADSTSPTTAPVRISVRLPGGIRMRFIRVEPGSYTMGSGHFYENEKPAHPVTLTRPFYLGECEVTQAQWRSLMKANPSHVRVSRNPVENVSWNDCQEFLKRLSSHVPRGMSVRLPTEAEWEYACRAGSTGEYCFGDDPSGLGEYAWYRETSGGRPHAAGIKRANAWGFRDMHGNVWEWCSDWYGPYAAGAQTDPHGPTTGTIRCLRGGDWNNQPWICRSAMRSADQTPDRRSAFIGFRVALSQADQTRPEFRTTKR